MRETQMTLWDAVKKQFCLDPTYTHLSNCILSTHPASVNAAIRNYQKKIDANPILTCKEHTALQTQTLNAAAEYLATLPEQIALTHSTTMGLTLVYNGIALKTDDEILTTTHDHYATVETLRFKAHNTKAKLIRISLYDEPNQADSNTIITRILNHITDKTRLLALTWVHSCTGVKLPITEIAKTINSINASRVEDDKIILCVDGLHGFGIEDFTTAQLDCDFFVTGCHKSFFGPRGTGLVWGKTTAWSRLEPFTPSFDEEAFVPWLKGEVADPLKIKARFYSPGGFPTFEYRWALTEAFRFHLSLGKEKIAQRVHALNQYCKEGLLQISGLNLLTPLTTDLSSGMICFTANNMTPPEIIENLLKYKLIASTTPYKNTAARFSPGILNSQKEIDKALNILEKIIKKR